MTRANKSFRLELTKEQQALILQNTGMEAERAGADGQCVEDAPGAQAGRQSALRRR